MTHDGDLSPMLSQSASAQADLSPMISGRGTKIIADARGAYLAGNAPALIEKLDAPQQQVFRRAMIAFACAYTDRAFRLIPDDAPEHDNLAQVQAWLADPTPDPDSALLDQLIDHGIAFAGGLWRDNEINGYSTESPVSDVVLRLALCLSAPTAAECGMYAMEAVIQACWMGLRGAAPYYWHGRRVSPRYKRQFRWIGLHYQLEAAWALLRGQPPRVLDPLPDHPLTDLSTLLGRMDERQHLIFRQLVIDAGLRWMDRTMNWGRESAAEWACLGLVREWVYQPSDLILGQAVQCINAVPYALDPRPQAIRSRVRSLIDAMRATSETSAAILAMEPFAPHIERGDSRSEWPIPLDAVQAWQIRAAQCILNSEAPPRLWQDQDEVSR